MNLLKHKKVFKRLLGIVLAVMMFLPMLPTAVPVAVSADDTANSVEASYFASSNGQGDNENGGQ